MYRADIVRRGDAVNGRLGALRRPLKQIGATAGDDF